MFGLVTLLLDQRYSVMSTPPATGCMHAGGGKCMQGVHWIVPGPRLAGLENGKRWKTDQIDCDCMLGVGIGMSLCSQMNYCGMASQVRRAS